MRGNPTTTGIVSVLLVSLFVVEAFGQDVGAPDAERLAGTHPAPAYSPYANRSFPDRPLFGDTHLHTSFSMDAGAFGARLTPHDAYRFARGEQVQSSTGQPVRLSRPSTSSSSRTTPTTWASSRTSSPASPRCSPIRRAASGTT